METQSYGSAIAISADRQTAEDESNFSGLLFN